MKPAGKEGKSPRAVPRIARRPPGMERIPLSGVQMQMWFLDQLVPGSPAYHIPRALRLTGELDVGLLARAIADVVRRHEILRTAYVYADGAPWQVVMPAADNLLEFEDLSAVPAGDVEEVIQARALTSVLSPFDFTSGRPVRFCLIKRDARSHVLVVTMHHICIDGLSVPVVFGEIAEFYEAHRAGKPASLPELEVQFADCVLWQLERTKADAFRRHLAYWEQQLAGLPQLELPADRQRPPVPTYSGGRATLELPPDVVSGVRALADRSGVTLLIVLAAAFAATLHRYTGHDEIVVGTATTGRNAPGLAEVVGCFVNALVLRIDVSDDPDFTELIRRTRDVVFGAWAHREVPFESVVAVVAPQRERSRNPLYQVWLQLVDAANADIQLPVEGILAEDYEIAVAITPLDLSLNVIERGTSLAFRAEFATDLFDRSRVERLLGHLERVLRAGAADPGVRVSGLPLLGEEELGLVSGVWQGAAAVQPGGAVHVQVAERAAADPGAVAAVAGSGVLSFGELDVLSGRLAGRLAVMGVVAGDVVVVALERGFELLVALVGVLKAGAAFVVVDPEHPAARLEFIFADTRARVVVSDARIAAVLPAPDEWALLEVDRDQELIAAAVPVRGEEVPADAAAYVLYTSGSTGTPKGVVVEHHALTTFLLGIRDLLKLAPGDRAIHHMALTFDWSIGELFTALVSGATLVFVAERDRMSPEAIGDLLEREHVTYLGAPPAMLAAIPDRPYPDLRYLVAGGEAFPGDLVNRWNTPGRRFINGYGPTETAVACAYYECEHREWSSTPPIGRPALRRRLYVLDRADNLCPIGVPGEIVVGGAGLARGYLNQPELTRQRFTPDPVRPGGRIYRTGDLGMWTPDGQIQFLGRIDSQVKLNGLRIELEEIESVLADHPAIAAAAVTVHGEGTARRLIGYIVPAGPAPDTAAAVLDTAGLGGWLAARLPRYMIPAVFTVLDRLPLTRVGKTDRTALPAPDLVTAPAEPPATPTEHQVAAIFTAILDRDQISREDNFFALGGTSIQAAQAVFQLRALFQLHAGQDAELGLGAFYAAPRVADIAQAVEEARTAATAQDDRAQDEVGLLMRFPVSRSQLGMWFLGQLSPGEPTFHIPYAISLDGPLDAGALQRALDAAVVRHAGLRTSIVAFDGVPEQHVADTGAVVIERIELPETLPPDEADRQAEVIAADRARQLFDLAAGAPIRATLIRTGPDRHLFVLVIHHVITDGTSMRILMEELSAGYRAELTGVPASPPPLWMSYGDYAVWQQDWMSGEELDRQLSYWREQLKGAPQVMALPTDRPRPARLSSRAARASITVGDKTIAGLATAAQAANATMFMAFLAGYAVVLSRYARQSDLVVATQAAGRTHAEFDPMIGLFANTILLRVSLAGNPSFTELLSRIRDTTADALAHQRLPFEKLVEGLAPDRSLAHAPLAQVQFAHRPSAPPGLDLPGVISSCRTLFTQTAKLDLDLYVDSQPGQDTTLFLDYSTDLFDPPWARQFLRCMAHLLEQAAKAPAAPVAQLPMLSDAELDELIAGRNYQSAPADPGDDAGILDLLRASPSRVIDCQEDLPASAVCDRAARLARVLADHGVGPETLAGICVERGAGMLTAMLATWWAGGAYVPLDPGFPVARLTAMTQIAGVRIIITDSANCELAQSVTGHAEVIRLDDPALTAAPPLAPVRVPGNALAYVICTSGSTGQPKGVAIEHRAVANLLASFGRSLELGRHDRLVAVTTLSFDIALLELLLPLLRGADLVIATLQETRESDRLWSLVRRSGVTAMQATPPTWRMLDLAGGVPAAVRLRLCGGEPLPVDLAERLITPGATLWNVYGPTETTVWSAARVVTSAADAAQIGRPIEHTRVYVLDERMVPVPVGVVGEVWLAGRGVARGYHDRPGLTARAFRPDPWSDEPGMRMYRTGDLGRWRDGAGLELIGRNDHQVKIRGYRIECGDIEAVLREHPGVRQAAVITADNAGEPQLVGYIVPRRNSSLSKPDADVLGELRPHLRAALPDYMVPSLVITLPALPLTPNAEVDRTALPAPVWGGSPSPAGRVEPRNAVEAALVAIWTEILAAAEPLGVHDDVFAAGGQSLTATRFTVRVADAYGVNLPVHQVFANPTIAALAEIIAADPDFGHATASTRRLDADARRGQ